MTIKREGAIKKLQKQKAEYLEEWVDYSGVAEAYDMAIEALSEPKTIIGIDIPYGSDKGIATIFKGNEKIFLEEAKEIIAVVRCKDCRWYDNRYGDVCHNPRYGDGWANYPPPDVDEDYWCKDGERKGGDDE